MADSLFDTSADALSDVLDAIHLRGEELTVARPAGHHEIRHQAGERMLHVVEQGPVELEIAGGHRARLETGDFALLATGAAHRLSCTEAAAWMSGRFLVEEHAAAPLLTVLPPVVVIRGSEVSLEWLRIGAGVIAAEIADPSPGSRVMVSRLLDLLFILALRAWSVLDDAPHPGWLTAALDRQLAPALTAVHRHPEQPWSTEELADLSALSRAAFSARFVRLVGEPPGRYLTRLRLARAADRLAGSTDPVGSIGKAVGYASEAAFSRAFTREYGVPPRAWRTAGRD